MPLKGRAGQWEGLERAAKGWKGLERAGKGWKVGIFGFVGTVSDSLKIRKFEEELKWKEAVLKSLKAYSGPFASGFGVLNGGGNCVRELRGMDLDHMLCTWQSWHVYF